MCRRSKNRCKIVYKGSGVLCSSGCRSLARDLKRACTRRLHDDTSPSYSMSFTSEDQSNVLQAVRDRSREHSSEKTREDLVTAFKKASHRLEPLAYDWQLDITEALLLALDCVVIATTGSGKTNAIRTT